jgi:hypothetical protein
VVQDLEHGEIDNWNFDAKALSKSAKIKLRLGISKFSSFIHYVLRLFALNTKIEGIAKISLVNDFDHVPSKIFVFETTTKGKDNIKDVSVIYKPKLLLITFLIIIEIIQIVYHLKL